MKEEEKNDVLFFPIVKVSLELEFNGSLTSDQSRSSFFSSFYGSRDFLFRMKAIAPKFSLIQSPTILPCTVIHQLRESYPFLQARGNGGGGWTKKVLQS